MPKYDILENHPLQLLTLEDVQAVVEEAVGDSPQEWKTAVAQREWRKLAGLVREALVDAYLRGAAAKGKWLPRLAQEWQRIEGQRSARVIGEVRAGYIGLLDRIYGGLYRHVLRRVPTAVLGRSGVFHLSRLLYYRNARVRDADKSALEELMELLYEGTGLRIELEFSWKSLGESAGEESPWRRRMNE